jgi:hypothetical protein
LEGQEFFGSTKQRVDIGPRFEGNSHKHDRVNFSQPIINTTSSGFIGSNVDVGKSNGIVKDGRFKNMSADMVCGELKGAHHH